MSIWKQTATLERMNERGKNTMMEFLEIVMIDIGADYVSARMPVNEKTRQPLGIMHGGSSCVLAETVGSVAGNFCVVAEKFYCVGLSISTNHLRSIREGYVVGTARPMHLGRSTQLWNIDIVDETQRLISTTRLTMAVLARSLD